VIVRQPPLRPGPGRRSAAIFALTAPALGIAFGVYLLVWQPMMIALFIVSMLVGAVSVWYALTRRGPIRFLALIGAVFAICSFVNFGIVLLIAELAPLAAFAIAGGYALGRYKQALVAAGHESREVDPPRQAVLIINPKSGGGKAAKWDLPGEALTRGIRPIVLQSGDDLTRLAEQAVADGADVIGMAGGDGSQALVATVAMRHGVAFVCVPSGTRNHFALDLGLNRTDVIGALAAFVDGVERDVDLGLVNDRVFVNNASLGIYARVVQSDSYRDAKMQTWMRSLPEILGPKAPPLDLHFEGPRTRQFHGAIVVLVSNNPYQFGHPEGVATRSRLDTGELGILAARVPGTATADGHAGVRGARQVWRFRHFRGAIEWSDATFEVRSGTPVPVGLDGETIILDPPLRFECLPAALRVRVPRYAARPQRITAKLTRNDITALFKVAAGRRYPRRSAEPTAAAVPTSAGG
jgi:diacylglycerol kinase family enzyme